MRRKLCVGRLKIQVKYNTYCTYQNLELGHVKVDVAKVNFWTSHVDFKSSLCQEHKRGDLQNKGTLMFK